MLGSTNLLLRGPLVALVLASAAFACSSSDDRDDDGAVPPPASTVGTGGGSTSGGPPPACYSDSRVGCQDLSWAEIEATIDGAYALLGSDTYQGYTKAEAKTTARTVYDNGTLPGARLSLFRARTTDGKPSRVVASVLDANGRPRIGLAASAFDVEGAAPSRVLRLGDATSDDVRLRISTVIDDSGSIMDCDAQFIADGVSHLFEATPPVYEAELIKFATDVKTVHPFTSDRAALAKAARGTCSDRGSTSLWDAVHLGLTDLQARTTGDEVPLLVVVSDGFDNDSGRSFAEVAETAASKRVATLVAGIGLADPFALGNLARVTGGAFVYVPSGARALELFEGLTSVLVDSYVVDFTPGARSITVHLPDGQTLSADVP